ncbi:unnamed protein product [marine sediment metagenome]|uniref:Uncharacterized protein n=1 Tax=marine sediment metagenome TaxID=412755 RepID=X1GQ44_9ZZZZ
MKVTNEDIEALRSVIVVLDGIVLKSQIHSVVSKAVSDRNRLTKLKSKLLIEFTKREFPEKKPNESNKSGH